MAIKFKYDGVEFEVSTPREAALVLRELRRVNTTTSNSVYAEALALLGRNAPPRTLSREQISNATSLAVEHTQAAVEHYRNLLARKAVDPERNERVAMTLKFLNGIGRARRMTAEEVAKILDVEHLKGLGPRSMLINNVLRDHGFDPNTVYTNTDRSEEGRVWVAGEKLAEAITALERVRPQKELLQE